MAWLLRIDLLGKRDDVPRHDGLLLLLDVAPQLFPHRNFLFYEHKQFRQINIHRLNFTFFEVTRDLVTNDTLGDLPGINLILTFGDNLLELFDFFRSEIIGLASQQLGDSL